MESERKVTVEVPFEGSMTEAISEAAKLLYSQERKDEYGSSMFSERKGDKIICTMTFKKKDSEAIFKVKLRGQ